MTADKNQPAPHRATTTLQNNYFFFRKLTPLLEVRLKGSVISECFSQTKDELVIRFEMEKGPTFIRALLSPSFACLSFPNDFSRARKNSIDLFPELIGQRVTGIRQYENERCFSIQTGGGLSLLFKMHGNRSNCVLFKGDDPEFLFKQNIESDLHLKLNELDRTINWSFEEFLKHKHNAGALYFIFGKVIWQYLERRGYNTATPEEQWQKIQDCLSQMESGRYYILEAEQKIIFSMVPMDNTVKEFSDPFNAINNFFLEYVHRDVYTKERTDLINRFKSNLHASEAYFEKTAQRLQALQHDDSYKIWADLIMANLHNIDPRKESVVLSNFYNENQPVEIKLKKLLSPQKNAEAFYRKSKKQQIEINLLQENLKQKEKEIEKLKGQLQFAINVEDLKSLRDLGASSGLNGDEEKRSGQLPYHQFEHGGFKILVGKNAKSNDTLTMRHAYKEDLWLHAKDVAGSHVLIKYQAGKKFPKDVIERAAQLAAYYSKRKKETLCPVVVTPRKFVRKRKGDPVGMVVVEKEETMLVEPKP